MCNDDQIVRWDLPCELVGDILVLAALPSKSVARCMCVAKSWRDAVKTRPSLHKGVLLNKAWRCAPVEPEIINGCQSKEVSLLDRYCISSGGDKVAWSTKESIIVFDVKTRNMVAKLKGSFAFGCFVGSSFLFGCSTWEVFGWDFILGPAFFFCNTTCDAFPTSIASSTKHVAMGGSLTYIKTWEVGVWHESRLQGHTRDIYTLTFAGDRLVSSSRDNTIRVWNVPRRECLRIFPTSFEASLISASSLNSKDVIVYAQARGNEVHLLGLEGGENLGVLKGHGESLKRIAGKDSRIVTSSYHGTVEVWDLQEKKVPIRAINSSGEIKGAWIYEESLVALDFKGRIMVWDFSTALE